MTEIETAETAEVVAEVAETTEAPKVAKPPKDEQNGVTRPTANSKTGHIWAMADELSASTGKPASRKDVLELAVSEGLNQATAATQYGRWTKYHGIQSTRSKAQAASAEVASVGDDHTSADEGRSVEAVAQVAPAE